MSPGRHCQTGEKAHGKLIQHVIGATINDVPLWNPNPNVSTSWHRDSGTTAPHMLKRMLH